MEDKNVNVTQTVEKGGIGLVGLVILFNNFNGDYDLYDLIANVLIKLAQ